MLDEVYDSLYSSLSVDMYADISSAESETKWNIPDDWVDLLNIIELHNVYSSVVKKTPIYKICPPREQWFMWATLTPLESVKVVILGQDPYYNGEAHGLAFSTIDGSVPPSLKNIYKCLLEHSLIDKMPKHGNLSSWARQGVLMINTAFSTASGSAKAHTSIWADLFKSLMQNLSSYGKRKNVCYHYFLWGKDAQRAVKYIDTDFHRIHTYTHPSPLSKVSFSACDHFTHVSINWNSVNDI
jgi:uracil-DNA glycosylase